MRQVDFKGTETTGSVRGIRIWVTYSHRTLIGLWGGTWETGTNLAVCKGGSRIIHSRIDPIEKLSASCECGFYAFWKFEDLLSQTEYLRDVRLRPFYGVIQGYGTVFIGDQGFRSSKARIEAISPAHLVGLSKKFEYREKHANWISKNYPDVAIFKDPRLMVQEFFPEG